MGYLSGPEWTRMPIARLRYVKKRNEWVLHWVDSNSRFRLYLDFAPCENVADLLAEIDADPTSIFWGRSALLSLVGDQWASWVGLSQRFSMVFRTCWRPLDRAFPRLLWKYD